MDDVTRQALDNAAASSAIEGLPLSESDFKIIEDIMEGRTTLQDYLKQLNAAAHSGVPYEGSCWTFQKKVLTIDKRFAG